MVSTSATFRIDEVPEEILKEEFTIRRFEVRAVADHPVHDFRPSPGSLSLLRRQLEAVTHHTAARHESPPGSLGDPSSRGGGVGRAPRWRLHCRDRCHEPEGKAQDSGNRVITPPGP